MGATPRRGARSPRSDAAEPQTFPRRRQSARSRLVLANHFHGPGVVWATTWARAGTGVRGCMAHAWRGLVGSAKLLYIAGPHARVGARLQAGRKRQPRPDAPRLDLH